MGGEIQVTRRGYTYSWDTRPGSNLNFILWPDEGPAPNKRLSLNMQPVEGMYEACWVSITDQYYIPRDQIPTDAQRVSSSPKAWLDMTFYSKAHFVGFGLSGEVAPKMLLSHKLHVVRSGQTISGTGQSTWLVNRKYDDGYESDDFKQWVELPAENANVGQYQDDPALSLTAEVTLWMGVAGMHGTSALVYARNSPNEHAYYDTPAWNVAWS